MFNNKIKEVNVKNGINLSYQSLKGIEVTYNIPLKNLLDNSYQVIINSKKVVLDDTSNCYNQFLNILKIDYEKKFILCFKIENGYHSEDFYLNDTLLKLLF